MWHHKFPSAELCIVIIINYNATFSLIRTASLIYLRLHFLQEVVVSNLAVAVLVEASEKELKLARTQRQAVALAESEKLGAVDSASAAQVKTIE